MIRGLLVAVSLLVTAQLSFASGDLTCLVSGEHEAADVDYIVHQGDKKIEFIIDDSAYDEFTISELSVDLALDIWDVPVKNNGKPKINKFDCQHSDLEHVDRPIRLNCSLSHDGDMCGDLVAAIHMEALKIAHPNKKHLTLCENRDARLRCKRGEEIRVTYANYGRTDADTCKRRNDDFSGECNNPEHTTRLQNECDGKRWCKVWSRDSFWAAGADPCPGVSEYLEVDYECVSPHERHLTLCENKDAQLKCQWGTEIEITHANYGRTDTETCPSPNANMYNINCTDPHHTERLSESCDGKRKCRVWSRNSFWGDTCEGTYKYLDVDYRCADYEWVWCPGSPFPHTSKATYTNINVPCSECGLDNVICVTDGETGSPAANADFDINFDDRSLTITFDDSTTTFDVWQASAQIGVDPNAIPVPEDFECSQDYLPGDLGIHTLTCSLPQSITEGFCGEILVATRFLTEQGKSGWCPGGYPLSPMATYTKVPVCNCVDATPAPTHAPTPMQTYAPTPMPTAAPGVCEEKEVYDDLVCKISGGSYEVASVDITAFFDDGILEFSIDDSNANFDVVKASVAIGFDVEDLSESRTSHNLILCEHMDKDIECPHGEVIKITYANYGRTDGTTCPSDHILTTDCTDATHTTTLQEHCDDKNECRVWSRNSFWGDTCSGTFKYLDVDYDCVANLDPSPEEFECMSAFPHDSSAVNTLHCSLPEEVDEEFCGDLVVAVHLLTKHGKESWCPGVEFPGSTATYTRVRVCGCEEEPMTTSLPTPMVTSAPTSEPTYMPTSEPTSMPTSEPTSEPTSLPTPMSTSEPTMMPEMCEEDDVVDDLVCTVSGGSYEVASVDAIAYFDDGMLEFSIDDSSSHFDVNKASVAIGLSIDDIIESRTPHNLILCEHMDKDIECPHGEVIKITYANYGRTDGTTCPSDHILTTDCTDATHTTTLQEHCDDKNKCRVWSRNSFWGDTCSGTFKYLDVDYDCVGDSTYTCMEDFPHTYASVNKLNCSLPEEVDEEFCDDLLVSVHLTTKQDKESWCPGEQFPDSTATYTRVRVCGCDDEEEDSHHYQL